MTFVFKHHSIVCLLGIACLVGSSKAQAQSHEEARKRSFAELLARRAKAERAEARLASRTAQTTRLSRPANAAGRDAASTSPLFARVAPVGASATGISSATPVAPSGFGAHKDSFVESLYPQILGREPSQSEVDYWAKALSKGASPNSIANTLWNSREHRNLVKTHTSPGIPLATAYRNALAASK